MPGRHTHTLPTGHDVMAEAPDTLLEIVLGTAPRPESDQPGSDRPENGRPGRGGWAGAAGQGRPGREAVQ
ncbi:hypothetical protein AB0I49_33185 [Streptomyces sp. NPDC050617]|uniref:hypothetical protein n=1 Tax=Streptomyces sp. NPDC050617 TaxID=3154628 RepID=UPI0034465540